MNYKPLTYNRFRAYLRIKLKNKSFSKTRVFLIIAVYILLSLTIFLLPHNVLTQYPYLKYFTDFMDFIPAIKQMEIKTYAPEMCKLYASYMFVVGVVCFGTIFMGLLIMQGKYKASTPAKEIQKNLKKFFKIKNFLYFFLFFLLILFCTYGFLSGRMIGYTRKGHSSTYFIDYPFEMLFYIDFWQAIVLFGILMCLVFLVAIIDSLFCKKLLCSNTKI